MGETIAQLRLQWNLLQIITWVLPVATSLLILETIPSGWWMVSVPILILGAICASLAIIQWKPVWTWLVLIAQGFLFAIGLIATVTGPPNHAGIPLLILAYPMILATEHLLSTAMSYSAQFSTTGDSSVKQFNAPALTVSLCHLYRNLGRDGIVFGVSFLLSLAIGALSAIGATTTVLSDPSLYAIVATISLALIVVLREE
jgi:hypothetical protein